MLIGMPDSLDLEFVAPLELGLTTLAHSATVTLVVVLKSHVYE